MVSSHDAMKEAWRKYRCILDHPDRQSITILGRKAGVCPPEMVEPFQALSQALVSTGYKNALRVEVPRNCSRGIEKGKPCQPDGTDCSLHNYGVAVDIDPPNPPTKEVRDGSANPLYGEKGHFEFGDIKLTKVQVEAVLAIRTAAGKPLFKWLGDSRIKDTMHFEVKVPPDATAVDWDTVEGGRPEGLLRSVVAGTAMTEDEEDDMPTPEEIAQAVWEFPMLSVDGPGVTSQLALSRAHRGVNALLLQPDVESDPAAFAEAIVEVMGPDLAKQVAAELTTRVG